ncbi:hypothetical protein KGF57_000335 [Candida theae]|uniref:Uncharacterized protein n=1 Tax=Candida theae TaxID=1198502 RepID=A0AAD5BJ45_9ASCO|nr:uncharacterized protein KGF57_000335 [Candida theae]KAI5967495.1 hypothetical protein KGF57_000335 [Candida theae]
MHSKDNDLSTTSSSSSSSSPTRTTFGTMSTATTATSATSGGQKVKTPLKKEELEKIARQLKKKLSKASITAKQSLSPTNMKTMAPSVPKSSPLRGYINANTQQNRDAHAHAHDSFLSSSPNIYSPNGKSPTHIKTAAATFLSSSPLKNVANGDSNDELNDSPTKKRRTTLSPSKMVLAELTPSGNGIGPENDNGEPQKQVLKPSLDMSTTPSRQDSRRNSKTTKSRDNNEADFEVAKTPAPDTEGADLLIYLATSPSPAKTYKPRVSINVPPSHSSPKESNSRSGYNSLNPQPQQQQQSSSASSFAVPQPPVTPKRVTTQHHQHTRTPQNRLTPFLNNLSSNLPSSGLTLTPNGFNMNDYVNFFTPSPGNAMNNKNILRTPDFNNLLNGTGGAGTGTGSSSGQTPLSKRLDGKIMNFNKVLYQEHGSDSTNKDL